MSDAPQTAPEWMLARDAKGTPLFWISADGTRRAPSDPPPRSEWNAEMCCAGCQQPQECIDYGALCSA